MGPMATPMENMIAGGVMIVGLVIFAALVIAVCRWLEPRAKPPAVNPK